MKDQCWRISLTIENIPNCTIIAETKTQVQLVFDTTRNESVPSVTYGVSQSLEALCPVLEPLVQILSIVRGVSFPVRGNTENHKRALHFFVQLSKNILKSNGAERETYMTLPTTAECRQAVWFCYPVRALLGVVSHSWQAESSGILGQASCKLFGRPRLGTVENDDFLVSQLHLGDKVTNKAGLSCERFSYQAAPQPNKNEWIDGSNGVPEAAPPPPKMQHVTPWFHLHGVDLESFELIVFLFLAATDKSSNNYPYHYHGYQKDGHIQHTETK